MPRPRPIDSAGVGLARVVCLSLKHRGFGDLLRTLCCFLWFLEEFLSELVGLETGQGIARAIARRKTARHRFIGRKLNFLAQPNHTVGIASWQ